MNVSAPWFFHDGEFTAGAVVRLSDDEATHARSSKRLGDSDAIVLFNGKGAIATARITANEKKGRRIDVELDQVDTLAPLSPAITIASAAPKGERATLLLNMITQLGATAFIPLQCERSVATGEKLAGSRGQRIVIEACKQARCAHLPMIAEPMSPNDVVIRGIDRDEVVLAAHPTGLPVREVVDHHLKDCDVTLLIGPEGGFTDDEVNAMRDSGAHIVNLGRTILRTETACVALLSFTRMYPNI